MINDSELQVADYAYDFEALVELALPADESLEFIQGAAEDMS